MTKSLMPSDLLHRHTHHHHSHHHPSYQYHNYHHHSLSPKTTASITPSTIQCTQFYTSHRQHYHHHHRHHNSKSTKSFFFSSFTTSSSSTSALLSTAQLHRQFKAMKKIKSSPVFFNNDRLIKSKPESTIPATPMITPSTSFSSDYLQPVLLKRSSWTDPCLDQWLANSLQSWLPPRIASSSRWNLLYSLEQHGCSIRTLYDRVQQHPLVCGNLIVIRTSDEEVIGAYVSESLKTEKYYYGSGECFLWKSDHKDQLQVYPWTGANDYMIFSNQDFIAIGGGDGRVGLFLHADLQTGHTQPCDTFDNDTLTQQHYFEIIGLEIWGFDY